jgi:hypothetical protein
MLLDEFRRHTMNLQLDQVLERDLPESNIGVRTNEAWTNAMNAGFYEVIEVQIGIPQIA